MLPLFRKNTISEDTRSFRRFRSFCLIKYGPLSGPTQKKTVINARDISAGGVLFASDTDFPKGSMLEIDVYLPPLKDFFTVIASVIKSVRIKDTDQHLVRARFTAIAPEDKHRINSYIKEMEKYPAMHRHLDKKGKQFKRRPHF